MANPGETATWGTLEELLLACAVNRYGTKCWESVAGEIQKRSSSTTFHSLITPNTCRSKYNDLKRRFSALNTQPEASPPVNTSTAADDSSDTNQASLWLEELRRLRIAELKRDLERYDESILSLQLKVKRLKEEREHNQSDEKDGGLDLHRNRDKEKEENEKDKKEESRDEPAEIPSPSPESGSGKPLLGGEETQSVNVAGDGDACKPGVEIVVKEMVEQVASPPDPTAATQKVVPTGENSYNGSSDSLAAVVGTVKEVPDSRDREKGNDSVELVGSVGGGDEERKAAKESSDVQSSASLSRRKRKEEVDAGNNGGRSGGGGGEDEPDGTPAGGSVEKNSRPLIEFLDAVRSESVFVHRLKSQESPRYKNMIRQHIDLASIRAKVEGGQYSDDYPSFYHDLLLLTVNATTFFSKGSPEYKAAIKLRRVISRFSKSLTNSTSSSFDNILEAAATLKKESLKTSDRVAESRSSSSCSESQINLKSAKTNVGARSVMACRKRSSIATKKSDDRLVSAAGMKSLGSSEKGKGKGVEVAARKPSDQINNKSSQFNSVMTKKRSRDQRFNSSSRSASNNTTCMAKTGHAATGTTTSTNTKSSSVGIGSRGSAGNKDLEAKQEKKSSGGNNIEKNKKTGAGISNDSGKKNSLGSFLSKMKRSGDVHNNNNKEKESSSTLWESLKVGAMVKGKSSSTTTGGSRGGGGEQKKKMGGDKSGKSSEVGGSSSSNGPPPPTKVYSARKGMAAQQAVLREKKEKLIREKEKKKKRREVEEEEESDDDDEEEEISEEVSRRPPKRAAALAAVGKRRRASGGGGDGESTTAKKRSRNK